MENKSKEDHKRREKRNNKYGWQIENKKIRFNSHLIEFCLECDDTTKSYLKGLRLDVNLWKNDALNDLVFTLYKHFTIPLSWKQFYIQFIYRHLDKCHPDLRSKWYIGKARELQ